MEQHNVSVVIPSKDRANVLERAIRSAYGQTVRVDEIIVVDDGSSDGTESLINELTTEFPSLKYVKNPVNKGAPFSRNRGAEESSGSLIAFLDSDDEWMPEKLEQQIKVMERHNTHAVFTNFEFHRPQGIQRGKVKEVIEESDLFGRNILGGTSSVLVRKDAFISVGGFTVELRSCQDWDLWIKLAALGKMYCIDQPLVKYHLDGGNRISADPSKALDGHKHIFSMVEPKIANLKAKQANKIKAMQKHRMAEVYVKNLGMKSKSFSSMIEAIKLWPSFGQFFNFCKIIYFIVFR
ncbi:glycosyltransferase family 2 protein [Agaribacter flavus]|uniref:Glycosyltransferase family 2 protein n=1 Tax=Agaribacter flavus TaxID=1902781 RepID=A0ABV7FQ63_9ALTE